MHRDSHLIELPFELDIRPRGQTLAAEKGEVDLVIGEHHGADRRDAVFFHVGAQRIEQLRADAFLAAIGGNVQGGDPAAPSWAQSPVEGNP